MIVWVDAQLSPVIASWLTSMFDVEAHSLRDLGLRDAADREIYVAARGVGSVILTKDRNFALLQRHLGSPPKVIWLCCGNTSNARLKEIVVASFPRVRALLDGAETLVEITAS